MSKKKQQLPARSGTIQIPGFIGVHQQHKKDCRFIQDVDNAGFQKPYKRPRKLTTEEFDALQREKQERIIVDDDPLDAVISDEELEATQKHEVSDDEEAAEESSDDEGDFRSLAHDVIQKNGYRTVQKWFELEAEPFKPKKKAKKEEVGCC